MLYRKGVGIMIINEEAKIFAGLRNDVKNVWQMPQGGVKNNESDRDAMLRELREETGLSVAEVEILTSSSERFCYDLPEKLSRKLWGGMYVGQCQRWFLLKFVGNEDRINIYGGRKAEFRDWRWLSKEALLENVIYFKNQLYTKVLNEFSSFLTK